MAITQYRSKRKVSGGRYKSSFKKKLRFTGRLPTLTKLAKTSKKTLRILGGHTKTFLFAAQTANVYDPVAKKHSQATIETVVESPASRHFARRNIMTKGTLIKTNKGNARITSRPGQEGTINAILIKK
jgi:small subunit ribosomal protein S8e